ncbi:MAG: isochorismatase family protein, partial [Leptospiraceae bacterium]|nr:isochorismatase family protein [Leptospiraceae bacterium]
MPKSILITQCLQNDFVELLQKYDPIPNLLHVGFEEAKRLLSEKAEEGPIDSVMEWAYLCSEEDLEIIHIRDWHDPKDQDQKQHLKYFGDHCLKNTKGAEFVFEKKILPSRKHSIVNASGLNDFLNTNLERILTPFKNEKIKVGIIGVWTEAKIFFLAYDLITRYPNFEVVTCSALTASSSRAMHFIALDQLHDILGVKIFSSIGAFTHHLTNSMPKLTGNIHGDKSLEKLLFEPGYEIKDTDKKILSYLFRDCKTVELECLDGGFSGNLVLKAKGHDVLGHIQVPTVVKVGERNSIARERNSFERIQEVLGNNAPNIVDFAELEDRGGIKYRYAAMLDGDVKTFQKLYAKSEDIEKIHKILEIVFLNQLGRLYEAARSEKLNLLHYYDFQNKYASSIRKNIESLIGKKANGEKIEILKGEFIPNICNFYERDLDSLREYNSVSHYMSYVHGDLNGANIIIDSQENVWIIDYFHTHRGHILKDLVKLENDILYIFTKIENEEDLKEGFRLTDILINCPDLGIPVTNERVSEFKNPFIIKALNTIVKLRQFYPSLIQSDRDPYQLYVPIVRYAMHTLSFDESSDLQKQWALYTGSLCSKKIQEYLKKSKELRVDFLNLSKLEPNKIGITILPGRKDRNRNLKDDIQTIRENNIQSVLCLMTMN